MPKSLREQVVVITGASSGIGRATARYMAGRGAAVVLTARRGDALRELAREIEERGGRALAVAGDVRRESDLRAVASAAVDRFGRIDTWVNNASVYIQGRLQDLELDDFRELLDVNFVGLVNGTRCALDVMLPRGEGVIVQVSSVAARRGVPYTTPYSAAKAAIDGFSSALRAELWGSGVRISVLYPPTVDTPIYHQGRGKLGVMPKPAAPVADPRQAAREIARLAETGARSRFFGWAGPLAAFDAVAPGAADWFLHHVEGFTYSGRMAGRDNLRTPSPLPPTERAGWRARGWNGLTVGEMVRVLPWEAVLTAGALGVVAGRASRRLPRRQ